MPEKKQIQFSEYILDCLKFEIECDLKNNINENITEIDIIEILIKKLINKRMTTKNTFGDSCSTFEVIDDENIK